MAKNVLIPLIDGFEEIEAVATIDILRRAGLRVVTAGFGKQEATGSHDITVKTDGTMEGVDAGRFDAIALPGGPGTKALRKEKGLRALLRFLHGEGKLIAAICAAPTVLADAELLDGKRATCFPAMEADMAKAIISHEEVVVDGNIITSRGAGTAIPFARAIVEALLGEEKAEQLARQIIFRCSEPANR